MTKAHMAYGQVSFKGCTRLASDKVYQLLAHGRWFSPDTPASSTTKTGRHDIAEIFLKVALKHQKSKSNHFCSTSDIRNESTRHLIKKTVYATCMLCIFLIILLNMLDGVMMIYVHRF